MSPNDDLDRLATAPRIRPDSRVADYLAHYRTPSGRTTSPVVALHTVADAIAVENERGYAGPVRHSCGRADLRQHFDRIAEEGRVAEPVFVRHNPGQFLR